MWHQQVPLEPADFSSSLPWVQGLHPCDDEEVESVHKASFDVRKDHKTALWSFVSVHFLWAKKRATCNKCVGRNLVTSKANTGLPWLTKSTADCGQQWDLTAFTGVQRQPKVVSLISFVTWVNQHIVLVGTTRESCLASIQRLTWNHSKLIEIKLE